MNKAIYKQLVAILFFSFLQIFFGEIKAREICYFSNVKEFGALISFLYIYVTLLKIMLY